MAQLDVYENLDEDSRKEIPFLLDIQHELHVHLQTHVMIPQVRTDAQKAGIDTLCPTFVIEEQSVFASVPEMSAYPVKDLGNKVSNLKDKRSEIFDAIDFLLSGF
jgi:hypothetical protein